MIIENKYNIKLSEIGTNNKITNKAILGDLEDIGGIHSNRAGYGILNISQTHLTWLLLEWKLQVIRRPSYNEKIKIRTWSSYSKKCFSYRDFEILDEQDNIVAIATSKWVLVDTESGKISIVKDSIIEKYEQEKNKFVFNTGEIEKIIEPQNYSQETKYNVKRADIDVNNHMHNLNYLDLAYDVLPEEIFRNEELNNVRITYKREIKLGETVKCQYSYENFKHIIAIKSEDGKILHALIEMH